MSTKYKYGKDGSYFDPETKRTYYKDPQYQKAYDDEWNRLEKLYKMKQEEQRRIERENFQRVLAQADALTKSMQALGYRTPLPWEQKNRFDGTEDSEIEKTSEEGYSKMNLLDYLDERLHGSFMQGVRITGNAASSLGLVGAGIAIPDDIMTDAGSFIIPDVEHKRQRRQRQGGTAQRTFMMPRDQQRNIFIQDGYLIGREKDYGPLRVTAEKHANRDAYKHEDGTYDPLPVYQTAPDAIDPNRLYAVPGYYKTYAIDDPEANLCHAGSFPMQYFIDESTGNLYQKGWDINDYGKDDGGASSKYGRITSWFGNTLDELGNPVVVTTGYQPAAIQLQDIANEPWPGSPDILIATNTSRMKSYHRDPIKTQLQKALSNKVYPRKSNDPNEPLEAVLPLKEIRIFGRPNNIDKY